MRNHFSNARIANWREDDSGLLRVTVVVLAEGVYPYAKEEISDPLPANLQSLNEIMQYIPADAFTPEALKTLEGKAATITITPEDAHQWREPENAMKDGLTVGAAAGEAWVDEGKLKMDFLIQDGETIRKIKNGDLIEVSAAYTGTLDFEDGVFNGQPYQARQGNFQFNHVLFLPAGEGRLGDAARIINKKGKTMHSVSVKFKNRTVTYRFQNEEDKAEAEKMAGDTREASAEEINNALETIKNLQEEIKVKTEELETEKGKVKEYAEKLQEVLAPEAQEALAEELLEQKNDEEEIIKSEVVEEERDELKNRVKNTKSRAERRRVIVAHIMNKRGVTVDENWKAEAVDGAFAALSATARSKTANRSVPGGEPNRTSAPPSQDAYARMMSFKNRNKEKK